ncbi:MAG: tetratricopeptide repeat protein [Xanthomonadales bacterium]|nr:tetratricopeptide repeat protein [Xanthomonadales bacterium]
MINIRIFCIMLMLLSLVACDDKASTPAAKPAARAQQDFAVNNVQAFQGIEQLKAELLMNPTDFATLSTLADMYFESAQYVDAFQTYDRAIAVNPDCADCYNDRGLSLFYIGDPASALESFDRAIALDPAFTHAWLSKGFVLISEGRYREAIAPLNKVKEIDTSGVLAIQADKFLAVVAENSPQ